MIRLKHLSGSLQGLTSEIDKSVLRIGRAPDCDVRFAQAVERIAQPNAAFDTANISAISAQLKHDADTQTARLAELAAEKVATERAKAATPAERPCSSWPRPCARCSRAPAIVRRGAG